MNVLVTGGRGWIGSHVVRELVARGHDAYAVIRKGISPRLAAPMRGPGRLFTIAADFGAPMAPKVRFDLVIHCAWYVNPKDYMSSNENIECLQKSISLLGRSLDCRCIFLGTCFEFAESPKPLSEASPTKPKSAYAFCKDMLRRRVERHHNAAWVRLFYQYGPYEKPERTLPKVIKSMLEKRQFFLPLRHLTRDYLHVEDVASAICTIAQSGLTGCVNVGSGEGSSTWGLLERLELSTGVRGLVGIDYTKRDDEPARIVADNTLLRSIGWTPKYTLDTGLKATYEWWRDHGARPV